MGFATICKFIFGAYVLYYFVIIGWDAVFAGRIKKDTSEDDIHFDVSASKTDFITDSDDEQPEGVSENDYQSSGNGQKKKRMKLPDEINLSVESNSQPIKVSDLMKNSAIVDEGHNLFASVRMDN